MRITYVGPHTGVEIIDSGQWAERGVPLDVDDELAARLCEQPTWERARRAPRPKAEPKPGRKPKAKPDPEPAAPAAATTSEPAHAGDEEAQP